MAVQLDVERLMSVVDAIREHNAMDWAEVGKAIDVSPSTLARMEKGEQPNVTTLCRLLRWSNIDVRKYISDVTQAELVPTPAMAEGGDANGGD